MAIRQWICTLLALAAVFFVAPRAQAETSLCTNLENVSETNTQMTNWGWQSVNCYINRGQPEGIWLASITVCKLGFVSPIDGQTAADDCNFEFRPGSNEVGVLAHIWPDGATETTCTNLHCAANLFLESGGSGPIYEAFYAIDAQDIISEVPGAMFIGCSCED